MAIPIMACSARPVTGGVDTHRDTHTAAVLDERGATLAVNEFPTGTAGYAALLAWMRSFGDLDRVGVEGTSSYGAGLARDLAHAGITVIEVDRPNRQARRRDGKNDPTDAVAAARACLSGQATGIAKAGTGNIEAIRVLRVARVSARYQRINTLNQLRALVVTAPDELRARFHNLPVTQLVNQGTRLRPGPPTSVEGATKFTIRLLCRRVVALDEQAHQLDRVLDELVAATAPALVARFGVGTDTAGALLVAVGDNPHRIHNEAAFARLCGVAPVEASSGAVTRHRLNRGGNRAANQALWRIAMVRLSTDKRTQTYIAKRIHDGKSKREAIRALKRHIAREIYRYLPT